MGCRLPGLLQVAVIHQALSWRARVEPPLEALQVVDEQQAVVAGGGQPVEDAPRERLLDGSGLADPADGRTLTRHLAPPRRAVT